MNCLGKIYLLVILIFSSVFVIAQDTKVSPSQLEKVNIDLNKINSVSLPVVLPINKIRVLDIRPDTGKLGFVATGRKFKQICILRRNDSSIENYLNKNHVPSTGTSYPDLLVVLKSWWLKDYGTDDPFQKKSLDVRYYSQCIIKMDIFMGNDRSYKSLIRIDTVLNLQYVLRKNIEEVFSSSVDYIIETINAALKSKDISAKKEIQKQSIYNYYRQYNNPPRIMKDLLEKGIYLTFKDFINNKPEPVEFIVEEDKKGSLLYVNQNGQKVLMNEIWGYSDSSGHFIKVGNQFFELTRSNNAYYFWGFIHQIFKGTSSNSENQLGLGQSIPLEMYRGTLHGKFVNPVRPMAVDMETGNVF